MNNIDNMSIWNDMLEAAVLYGYHPTVPYELTSVVSHFPRSILQGKSHKIKTSYSNNILCNILYMQINISLLK